MEMQKEKSDLIANIVVGIMKILPPFLVGLMAKVASDIRDGRKLSVIGWMAIVALSLSGTFFSNWICEEYHISNHATVVANAFATLFSEQLFKILVGNSIVIIQSWVKSNLKFTISSMEKEENKNITPNKPD